MYLTYLSISTIIRFIQAMKMTRKEASRKKNENKVWRNLYPEFGGKTLAPKFSIGDNVRITKKKNVFDKGYTQQWTEEVFKVSKNSIDNSSYI